MLWLRTKGPARRLISLIVLLLVAQSAVGGHHLANAQATPPEPDTRTYLPMILGKQPTPQAPDTNTHAASTDTNTHAAVSPPPDGASWYMAGAIQRWLR